MSCKTCYPAIITNDGWYSILNTLYGGVPIAWRLHLYSNDRIPCCSDVLDDFTDVTSGEFPGYASHVLVWNAPVILKSRWRLTSVPFTFTRSAGVGGPVTVYGWAITDDNNREGTGTGTGDVGKLVMAKYLDQPITIISSGNFVQSIQAAISQSSCVGSGRGSCW